VKDSRSELNDEQELSHALMANIEHDHSQIYVNESIASTSIIDSSCSHHMTCDKLKI
jgi:hypothetical protein